MTAANLFTALSGYLDCYVYETLGLEKPKWGIEIVLLHDDVFSTDQQTKLLEFSCTG